MKRSLTDKKRKGVIQIVLFVTAIISYNKLIYSIKRIISRVDPGQYAAPSRRLIFPFSQREYQYGLYTDLPAPWTGNTERSYQTGSRPTRSSKHGHAINLYLVLSARKKPRAVGLQTEK